MPDTSKQAVSTLFDVIIGHGVEDIVCSPGSRNAPLLMAARARTDARKHIIIDERAAAFFALGIASISRKPVALVCTSGTALLNYAPAIAEAYYRGLPIIVVSADRPKEWIDQDDSQTIRQFEVLRNFVKASYELDDREQYDNADWYDNRITNDAMITALSPKQGPVHINVRLSPPLNELVEYKLTHQKPPRLIQKLPILPEVDKDTIKDLASTLLNKKILVTAGFLQPDSKINKALLKFREHPNVTIMAETISNTHLPREDYAVDSVIADMSDENRRNMVPDIVISLGGSLISRMLKEFLREGAKSGKTQHWSVGFNHNTVDCFQALSLRIEADPARFINLLSAEMAHQRRLLEEENYRLLNDEERTQIKKANNYSEKFLRLKELAIQRIFRFASEIPWVELSAFVEIMNKIPKEYNLFLSNGTVVRYAQIIPYDLPHASFCNRGVSGIEGTIATAIGAEVYSNSPTLLITGDMSLTHDLGSLALAARSASKLKIIVINNSGGGIFRFIKATSGLPGREGFFCVDPKLNLPDISAAFGFKYSKADSFESLKDGLRDLFSEENKESRCIFEIFVPSDKSALFLRQFLRINASR